MKYPIISDIAASKEMLTNFQGYDNRLGCLEGSFYDESNVTADYYPILSQRDKRTQALGDIPYIPDNVAETRFVASSKDYNSERIINTSDGAELVSILCDSISSGSEEDGTTTNRTGIIEPGLVYGTERIITKSNGMGKNLIPFMDSIYWYYDSNTMQYTRATDSTAWGFYSLVDVEPSESYAFSFKSDVKDENGVKLEPYIYYRLYDEDGKYVSGGYKDDDCNVRFTTPSNAKKLGITVKVLKKYEQSFTDSPQRYLSEFQLEKSGKPTGYEEYTGDLNFHMFANREHNLVRMGSKLVIFPERLWVDVDGENKGKFGTLDDFISCYAPVISMCDSSGEPIDWHDSSYYTETDSEGSLVHPPHTGDYMITTNSSGQDSIKVYSELTKSWSTVTSTYVSIKVLNQNVMGSRISEGDGVTVMTFTTSRTWGTGTFECVPNADQLFVNELDKKDRLYFRSLFDVHYMQINDMGTYDINPKAFTAPVKKVVKKGSYTYYIMPGFIKAKTISVPSGCPFVIKRSVPNMAFVVECQNRLWGCSKDGHEIYCSKLGDPTNWNYFEGTAADSYAATVGSSGKFTGAIVYNQNPIFFKENSYVKVSVSSSGAHSYREQTAEGVGIGSHRSIVNIDNALYYLSSNGVYAFDGSLPQKVSEQLGKHRYECGIASKIGSKYYLSALEKNNSLQGDATRQDVEDGNANHIILVFDTNKGIWTKEDGGKYLLTDLYSKDDTLYMTRKCKSGTKKWYETWMVGVPCYLKKNRLDTSDFFYGDKTKALEYTTVSEGGQEKNIEWYVDSPPIGYALTNNKYIGRINIRMSLEIGAYADFWLKYDNDDKWTHIFNMSGKGTKSFTIPVTPKRCDTFKYRLSGKGDCKVISITKSIEEGSDV